MPRCRRLTGVVFNLDQGHNKTAPLDGGIIQGNVGIGTKTPVSPLNAVAEGSNGGVSDDIRLESYGPTYYIVRARGTYAAPANLVNGDTLGVMEAAGFVNGALANTSGLFMFYRGDGTTDLTEMQFMTSGAIKMDLNSQGDLGISSRSPLAPLYVVGNASISTANANQTFFNFSSTTALSHSTGLTQNNGASAIFSANVWSNASFVSNDAPLRLPTRV